MELYGATDIGKVRDTNQDSYAIIRFDEQHAALIVCDGMGGANGGNIASQTAVEVIGSHLKEAFDPAFSDMQIEKLLDTAIHKANIAVFDKAQSDQTLAGMGTTVVTVILCKDRAYIAHAGDSRAYLLPKDGGLKQLTKDHSIVQQMLESGQITQREAEHHPKRNVITRALGVGEALKIDMQQSAVQSGEKFMLCSDGLTNFVPALQMQAVLSENSPKEACSQLVAMANENGGGDNITVVIAALE